MKVADLYIAVVFVSLCAVAGWSAHEWYVRETGKVRHLEQDLQRVIRSLPESVTHDDLFTSTKDRAYANS